MSLKKESVPDEGIRNRPYYEPFLDGDRPRRAYTITDDGEIKIEALDVMHDIQDVNFMRFMAAECRNWRTPDFTKEIEEYYRIFNRHLSAQNTDGFTAREAFMKEVFSEIHDDIVEYLRTFIHFDDFRIYDVAATFTIHTFFKHQMPMCPILLVEGLYGTDRCVCISVCTVQSRGRMQLLLIYMASSSIRI